MKGSQLRLYAITSGKIEEEELYRRTELLLENNITMLQYRDKNRVGKEKEKVARTLHTLCRAYHVPFIINDDVELAKKIKAEGVHLGPKDMDPIEARKILGEEAIIGVSARTVKGALIAKEKRADYLGVGAAFPTNSKSDAIVIPKQRYQDIVQKTSLPVVAIGGITLENILELQGSMVEGVAVIHGLFEAEDIKMAAQQFLALVEQVVKA